MGAGQIGGIATLLDIDFNNPAGFLGTRTEATEAQFLVTYLSHAMMFCVGSLLEAHVVLTPASCVVGERYKFDVFAGTHKFMEYAGITRQVHHICVHRGYNHTQRMLECSTDNIALLVLNQQFSFHTKEFGADFIINRLRYGTQGDIRPHVLAEKLTCQYYGWGSRRNGYLVPLLIHLRRMDVTILPPDRCLDMWNYRDKYLCLQQPPCKTEDFGALCPDDMGSVIVCSGLAVGMMASRLVDRPCGVGFLDLTQYKKFLSCGVDDSRDVIEHDDLVDFEFSKKTPHPTPSLATVPASDSKEQPTDDPEYIVPEVVEGEKF